MNVSSSKICAINGLKLSLLLWAGLCLLPLLNSDAYSSDLELLHTNNYVRYNEQNKKYYKITRSSPIHLLGAGNETMSFQMVVKGIENSDERLSIECPEFSGPAFFDIKNINHFSLEKCQEHFLPDCLVPFDDLTIANKYDLSNGFKVIWFDFHIPVNQAPGSYSGEIKVRIGGDKLRRVQIELQVYPFNLTMKPSLKADLNNYGVKFVKEWGVETGSDAAYRIERAFYRMAREHWMTFNPMPYKSQRGKPHLTMAPELEGSGDKIRVKDWREYDRRYGPLFDGTAFDDGIPIDHQYLPFNPEWPSEFSNYLTRRDVYEREWELIAGEFESHFSEKEWNKTVFQIYMNQKPRPHNRIPWNLDEPKGDKDYRALRYYADLVHTVFPPSENDRFKFRIDISHFYCDKHKGNRLKDFRRNRGQYLLESVDIWAISQHSMDSAVAQKQALKLRKKGKIIYEYFSGGRMPLIGEPLLKGVKYGWNSWLRKEDGILFWNTVKRADKVSDGKDFLIYAGQNRNFDGPIASIRLKAIRRGIQDYEYFKAASQYRNVDSITAKYMTENPEDYQKCRAELANIIISATN